jgi:hypothetical protein
MSTFRTTSSFRRQRWYSWVIEGRLSKSRLLAQLGGIDVFSGIVYIKPIHQIAHKHQHAQRRTYKVESSVELTLDSRVGQAEVEFRSTKSNSNGFWVDEKNDVLLTSLRGEAG